MVFGDYCFAWLIVPNHQILWLFYMSLALSLYLSLLNFPFFQQESHIPRYYRHKVGSTDMLPLLKSQNSSVLLAQGRKYKYVLTVGFLQISGSTAPPNRYFR
jgi:hypothetical protein